jgi:hypothetical protein
MALFKQEVKHDIRKTKEAVVPLILGTGILLMGTILLCLMLVHLLNWGVRALPMWSCYGIVGILGACCGGALLYAGKKRFESFNPLPEQSIGALKENVQWIMGPKK